MGYICRRLVSLPLDGKSPLTNETLHQWQHEHARVPRVSTVFGGLDMTLSANPGHEQGAMRVLGRQRLSRHDSGRDVIKFVKDCLLMPAIDEW